MICWSCKAEVAAGALDGSLRASAEVAEDVRLTARELEVLRLKPAFAKLSARALVDGAVHAEAELLSSVVPRGPRPA